MNPYKINFHPFPQVGNLVGQFNNKHKTIINIINHQPKHMQQKYIFKHIKGNMVIKHQIFTSNRNTYNHATNIMLIKSRKHNIRSYKTHKKHTQIRIIY